MNRCPCDSCPKIAGHVEPASGDLHRRLPVWTLKNAGGKVVQGTDVHDRALALRQYTLPGPAYRMGLGSLVLPTTAKGRKRLERDRAKYRLHKVLPRSSGDRGRLRDLSVISCFLCHALALKEHANSSWPGKAILAWVVAGLKDPDSPVYQMAITEVEFEDFIHKPRQLRWWQNRVTELREMSR